jgi:hypothetical protein
MDHVDDNDDQLPALLDALEQHFDVTVAEPQDGPAIAIITIDTSIDKLTDVLAHLLISLHEHWGAPQKYLVQMKTTQGTGKTKGSMETAVTHLGLTAAFGPRHTDIKADAEDLNLPCFAAD